MINLRFDFEYIMMTNVFFMRKRYRISFFLTMTFSVFLVNATNFRRASVCRSQCSVSLHGAVEEHPFYLKVSLWKFQFIQSILLLCKHIYFSSFFAVFLALAAVSVCF